MIDSTQAPVKPNATTLSPKPVDWIGIDGCRGGWIIAWLKDGCPAEIRFAESLQPFLKQAPKDAVILIDMILYKPDETSPRPFDRIAKSQLGKWHSRVFPAPPKEALSAQDYPEACQKSFSSKWKENFQTMLQPISKNPRGQPPVYPRGTINRIPSRDCLQTTECKHRG